MIVLLLSVLFTSLKLQASVPLIASPQTLPDLVEKILPGVGNISTTTITKTRVLGMDEYLRLFEIPQERRQTSLGSGFIIDKDGFMLTNFHVVQEADEVWVTLVDKRQFLAKIIGKDAKLDIALLQIRDKTRRIPTDLKPVPLGDSDAIRVAEPVFAVGNPFGLQSTVTVGIVSAKDRTIGLGPFDKLIQTDASINPGNSGGPLFNFKGEVIGINSAIRSETGQSSGLGFAIPINEAKKILDDLKKYGRVPRPWLGIRGERMTPQLEIRHDLATSKGVLVYTIIKNAPGFLAGLRNGDILISIDSQNISEPNDVERILAKHKPNDSILLKYYRGERVREAKVKLQELPPLDDLPGGII
jgi:serine protease Do